MKMNVHKNVSNIMLPTSLAIVLIILWQTEVLHKIIRADTVTLPLPSRIFEIIVGNTDTSLRHIEMTLLVALAGLFFGSLLGVLIATIATVAKKWGMGGLSVASAFNAIPLVALAPVINNWTRGMSDEVSIRSTVAKIIVVTIFCTAAMSVNAYRGLTELKPFSEDLMKSYSASKGAVLMKLRIPNCIPYLFTALRVSVPACIIGTLVSEYFAEETIGVGRQIRENIVKGQYPTAWGYITIACMLGIMFYMSLLLAEYYALKKFKA